MFRSTCFILIFLFSVVGCKNPDPKSSQARNDPPVVCVVNYPLEYFAARIGGDHIQVIFPAPHDIDPAFWKPAANDIETFQSADLIFLNGADYAKWINFSSLPSHKLVDTSEAFQDQFIEIEKGFVHRHGPEGEHSHKGTAFTTWLDFHQAEMHAKAIKEALIEILPDQKEQFEKNFDRLAEDLKRLDVEFKKAAGQLDGKPIVASHPIYQYFSRRYGLNSKSVLWEPEIVPDEKSLENLESILKTHPAKWMIWEGMPADETKKILREKYSIESIVVSPKFNRGKDSLDWLATMNLNLEALKTIK